MEPPTLIYSICDLGDYLPVTLDLYIPKFSNIKSQNDDTFYVWSRLGKIGHI